MEKNFLSTKIVWAKTRFPPKPACLTPFDISCTKPKPAQCLPSLFYFLFPTWPNTSRLVFFAQPIGPTPLLWLPYTGCAVCATAYHAPLAAGRHTDLMSASCCQSSFEPWTPSLLVELKNRMKRSKEGSCDVPPLSKDG
jgi:hypothetical protein